MQRSVAVKRTPDTRGQQSAAPTEFWRHFRVNVWLSIAVIVAFCAVTYGRTLGSFFLADDIGEVRYIHQIFSAGRWDLFWSNFTGNFMQVPNMSVYRPMLLLTLMFDYAIWKGNALGYYLSNLFYYTGASALLCVFLRMLCASFGKLRAAAVGLTAALLFAANPLHCESISWVVGRVDTACCMFYLAAICSVMKGSGFFRSPGETAEAGSPIWNRLGVLFFVMAICVKEMAIGFAPVLSAIAFFFVGSKGGARHGIAPFSDQAGPGVALSENGGQDLAEAFVNRSGSVGAQIEIFSWLRDRFSVVWKFSGIAWLATAVYFVVRYLALGTLLGGYNGSVGAAQSAGAIAKWMDLDNWHRLLFPFSVDIFASGSLLERGLFAAYLGAIGLVFVRILACSLPWRWLAFLLVWAATLAAPIYRLWGLGFNLEGARFCFFLTMSLSSLLPVLLFAPETKLPTVFSRRLTICAVISMAAIFFVFSKTAYATNLLWLHAGKEVRAVMNQASALSQDCPADEKLILLGVPKRHAGAHMILNGPTLQMLLSPPFVQDERAKKLLTFDSVLFGEEQIINGERLRFLVNKPGFHGPFVWSSTKRDFVRLELSASNVDAALNLYSREKGANQGATASDGMKFGDLNVSPLDYSYLKLSFRSSKNAIPLPFRVQWKGDTSIPDFKNGSFAEQIVPAQAELSANRNRTIFVPLGSNWRWYAQSKISQIQISFPGVDQFSLNEVSLLPADKVCPRFEKQDKCNSSGALCYVPGSKLKVSSTEGKAVLVQLSKNQFFFDMQNEELNRGVLHKELTLASPNADIVFSKHDLEGSGYYQIRARALDESGHAIGAFSDPLTIWVQN